MCCAFYENSKFILKNVGIFIAMLFATTLPLLWHSPSYKEEVMWNRVICMPQSPEQPVPGTCEISIKSEDTMCFVCDVSAMHEVGTL